MIQEPQQAETIEIPIAESMTTRQTNSMKKITLNKNQSNQNNKNRTTIVQIPKQNSKPRVFLLTRPAKPQLVAQSVQHPHQKNLNLLRTTTRTATNIASQTQSKIIRIPFLPRSQVQTVSVKSNQANQVLKKGPIIVPLEVTQYPYLNRNTVQASQLQIQKQDSIHAQQGATRYPITQQVNTNQLRSSPTEISNQLQTQQSVTSTIPQSAVPNNLNLSENKTIQTPLTLASMAGIELTGADMSLSQADMSGAMPPTATVEEINVPVFIDEYFQQATISTSSVTTTNNNIHNISNNNTHNNNNNKSNGKGNEVNNCLDTFENFDFDIDLLTEDISEDGKEDKYFELLEQQQQQHHLQDQLQTQLTEVDDDLKLKINIQQNSVDIENIKEQQMHKQELQLQLMLDEFLYSNNNNNSSNTNSCNPNNIITNNTSNNNNNNMTNMNSTPEVYDLSQESIFKFAPNSQLTDDILLEVSDLCSSNSTDNLIEEAIDITNCDNDFSLNDCFINSQYNDIMFSVGLWSSQSASSQINKLSQEISEAEPTIAPDLIHYPSSAATTSASVQPLAHGLISIDDEASCTSQFFDELTMDGNDSKSSINPLKRNGGNPANKHMKEKRLKLRLDTKRCREIESSQKCELNTPNVINFILKNEKPTDTMGPADNSMDSIYHKLISRSPQCASVTSEIIVDDISYDFSPPNTPYSVNSISNQTNFTGFMNTAPNSPASSIATTINTSVTNKRGRGRPAKLHSDIPDLSTIQHLSEAEQKKLLERAKNNEASRKSRLKHKERDNELERDENYLFQKNSELSMELQKLRKMEQKFQKALRVQHFQFKREQ